MAANLVPASMAVRAGDFVFTWRRAIPDSIPAKSSTTRRGWSSAMAATSSQAVADETRQTFRLIEASWLEAVCQLDDVVDASVWLRDPRDFHEMNAAYGEFFTKACPTRSIFRIDFMFDCRVEIKVTAYRPLAAGQ